MRRTDVPFRARSHLIRRKTAPEIAELDYVYRDCIELMPSKRQYMLPEGESGFRGRVPFYKGIVYRRNQVFERKGCKSFCKRLSETVIDFFTRPPFDIPSEVIHTESCRCFSSTREIPAQGTPHLERHVYIVYREKGFLLLNAGSVILLFPGSGVHAGLPSGCRKAGYDGNGQ